ncbi:unnamed protein product [Urochloa humidicola]
MGVEPERDSDEQRRPLLSSSSPPASVEQHQQHYKFLGRSSSFVLRGGGGGVGGLGWGGPEVSANDIRSAASLPIPSFRSTGHHPSPSPYSRSPPPDSMSSYSGDCSSNSYSDGCQPLHRRLMDAPARQRHAIVDPPVIPRPWRRR